MQYLWHFDVCQDNVYLASLFACHYVQSHAAISRKHNCSIGEETQMLTLLPSMPFIALCCTVSTARSFVPYLTR